MEGTISALAALGMIGVLASVAQSPAAAVKPNALFSSNAVLQRGIPVPVWGDARDGEQVTVEFRGQKVSTVARDGRWMVKLQPMVEGGPYVMKISGDGDPIVLRNVMVGEVWFCGGQSNMEWRLDNSTGGPAAIADSHDPMLRLFEVPRLALDTPARDVNGEWRVSKPETSPSFSGVGYFFGRELRKALNVPIGLVNANQGATMAQAWMPRGVLEADPSFKPILDNPWPEQWMILRPTGVYNGMIAPIQGYAMRGAIWYQGESNTGESFLYQKVFPAMVKSWRDGWGIGDFPFLTTQLAPFEAEAASAEPVDSTWAELRESQVVTTRTVPNCEMTVIIDAGEPKDIHPKDKETVGHRLALIARSHVYGDRVISSGPVYKSMKVSGNKAVLTFTDIAGGLEAKGGPLKGFAIAGADRKFVWADAAISGDKVVVSSPSVSHPVAVRYGWSCCPDVNLYNTAGLPASPFRTDDFPLLTGPK